MRNAIRTALAIVGMCLIGLLATPAGAQVSAAPTWQDTPGKFHQWTYQMMKDMAEEMGQMTEQMAASDLAPDRQRQMAERMERMATIMRYVSGLVARPAIRESEWPPQMDEMRRQMDEMLRDPRMTGGAR